MKKVKNFQKISDAAFMSHFMGFDALYLDSYREDVKVIQENIKSECDVNLSHIEAFYFWCWRSDCVAFEPDKTNEMRDKHNVEFDWLPIADNDAENMGKWFLEFTSKFVSYGFLEPQKADDKKPDTVMNAPIRKSFKMNKKVPPGVPGKMR